MLRKKFAGGFGSSKTATPSHFNLSRKLRVSDPVRRAAAMTVEVLEGRTMLASISLTNGNLVVLGDMAIPNTITVKPSGTNLIAKVGSLSATYSAADVKLIRLIGGLKADNISIDPSITITGWIEGGKSSDTLSGGGGNDVIMDISGVNILNGNGGDDLLIGGAGDETLNGGSGNDTLYGNRGADSLNGGDGNDYIDGGNNDTGRNNADGGAGTDTAVNVLRYKNIETLLPKTNKPAGSVPIQLTNNVLIVTGQADTGNVISVTLSSDPNYIVASAGAYTISYPVSQVQSIRIVGGALSDYLLVGSSVTLPASIDGGAGNDVIYGGSGNDSINGGDGSDRIYANDGNDTINGGAGADIIYAGSGNDSVSAGDGNDSIYGDQGNDSLDGGAGTDYADGGAGTDASANIVTTINVESTLGSGTGTGTGGTGTGGTGTGGTGTGTTTGTVGGTIPIDANAVKPVPVMTIMATTIPAGQSVFVHALGTVLGAGTVITARFEWDFGDTNGKYNKLVGFNAAHAYDTPGTYTLTLRVYNELHGAAEIKQTITVTPSGRSALYVSSVSGDDNNDGATINTPIRTMDKLNAMLSARGDVDVYFKRGETFDLTSTLSLRRSNVHLTAYGSGSNPVIRWAGALDLSIMVRAEESTSLTSIDNLTFDSIYNGTDGSRTGMPFAVKLNNEQITLRNNIFLNVGYAIQTNVNPSGVLIQDNSAPSDTGVRDYFLWGQGSDFTVLGNYVANTTREHTIRLSGMTRILFAYNDLNNKDRTSVDPEDIAKSCLNIQKGSYAYVYHNTLRGPWTFGPLGGSQGVNDKSARWSYGVAEGNIGYDTLNLVHGAEHIMIENNVFQNTDGLAIEIQGYSSTYDRQVSDVTIANNTAINSGTKGRFVVLEGSASGISLISNVYKSDNMFVGSYGTAAVYVNDTSLHSFKTIANNVWPLPDVSLWIKINAGYAINIMGLSANNLIAYLDQNEWNALPQVQTDYFQNTALDSKFTPTSTSTAATVSNPIKGVYVDYYGNPRTLTGKWSAGAVVV